MKRLIEVLKVTITFMLLAFFIGCSKSGDIAHPNDGGNNGGGTAKLSLNVMVASDSLFPNQVTMVNWSTNKPATVGNTTGTTGSINAGPYSSLPTENKSVDVSITATAGTESASKTVKFIVFSQTLTDFCWNYTSNAYGKWRNTRVTVDGVEKPELVDNDGKWSYRPDGKRWLYNQQGQWLGYYQLSYSGGKTFVNLGAANSPPNLFEVESLSGSQMVLLQNVNGSLFRAFYVKE